MSKIATRIFSHYSKAQESRKASVPLSVQSFAVEGNVARAVVHIPATFSRNLNNDEIAASVQAAIPKARYLRGSLIREQATDMYTLFMASATRTMSKEQASAEDLIEIATNVFRDADDNIWSLTEDASGSYFVAQDTEDFNDLIKGVRSRHIATASLEIALSESFNAGDFIAVYDVASESYQFGLAVDDKSAYFNALDVINPVSPHMVAYTHENAAKIDGAPSKQRVLDYYRRLYGHNPAFYKKLEQLIKKQLMAF